jgi:UDP:flavonoid glycosyltransferase YjiC (YdhE family)
MVCLPLFWDQVDNAQRLAETGFGARLEAYAAGAGELTGAIDRLLADRALAARLAAVSARLQANPGTVRAANLVEQLARDGQPVLA